MTAKEDAQAARVEQNAENQRRQDEFGFAVATHQDPDKVKGTELAKKTREAHADQIARDQELQSDNDSSTPDDNVVSSAVKGDGKKDYVERNVVQKDIAVDAKAPESTAYDQAAAFADKSELKSDTKAEVKASGDAKAAKPKS